MKRYVITIFAVAVMIFSGCSLNDISQTTKKENVTSSVVQTENTDDKNKTKIVEYQKRLDELNEKYDTNYSFPNNDEGREWLLSLSPEQFDSYVMSYIDGSIHDIEKPRLRNDAADMGFGGSEGMPNYNHDLMSPTSKVVGTS